MKLYWMAGLLGMVLLCAGCQAEEDICIPDCTEEISVSASSVTENEEDVIRCPLSAFPSEKIVYPACMELELKKEEVRRILSEAKIGDVCVYVAETVSAALYAVYPSDTGYTAFYPIHENAEVYAFMESVRVVPFEDIFGKSGLQLIFGVGANYESHIYFLWENARPTVLFEASHRDMFTGDVFVQYYGSLGVGGLCRMETDGMYRYNLTGALENIFPPDIFHIPYMPAFSSQKLLNGHQGIFTFQVKNRESGETHTYAAWLDNGVFCLTQEGKT